MNRLVLLLSLLISSLCHSVVSAETHYVTTYEALENVQQMFKDSDVDYYLVQDNNLTHYTVFVDAEPMKGWEHKCYTAHVPRKTILPLSMSVPVLQEGKMPPASKLSPLSVKNRYGSNSKERPNIPSANLFTVDENIAKRTFAVILSGGVNRNANYERYWNDCAFIYQTLRRSYCIPRQNIHVIMSDGISPEEDMLTISGTYKSSPLDLDFDGVNDIQYSATKKNIENVLAQLSDELETDDHLLFYVIDHGGANDDFSNSYINLWGTEKLYDYELASLLSPMLQKNVSVNAVLGQCFSGGFVDDLSEIGCVVSTASSGSEPSWACRDLMYDEFVYRWTSAVNGMDTHKNRIDADTNNDGHISMYEAFSHAKRADTANENPQFYGGLYSYANSLSFSHLPLSNDIYIKDNPEDIGDEPNLTTDKFWKSPSIYVRNQNDNIEEHENPIYSEDHQIAYVKVKVHNKGEKAHLGTKWVHVNWAQASTGIKSKTWRGRESYNDHQTGGALESGKIDTIPPGGTYRTTTLRWLLPSSMIDAEEGEFHYCLYAKILDGPTDEVFVDGQASFDVRGSNKDAQKNVTIIRKKDLNKSFNVFIRNTESDSKQYSLEWMPETLKDATLFTCASVEMEMSPTVYSAWERGGLKCVDVQQIGTSSGEAPMRRVKMMSKNSKLQSVILNPNEFDRVKLKFNFIKLPPINTTYSIDLVQKDQNGNIVGGETFVIESPAPSSTPTEINTEPLDNDKICLSLEGQQFESVTWYNNKEVNIGSSESIIVSPYFEDMNYSVVAITEDGEAVTKSISLKEYYGIKDVSMTANQLAVNLRKNAPANSVIDVVFVPDGTIKATCDVPTSANSVSINSTGFPKGLYNVRYLVNSVIIDQQKIALK